VSLTVQIVYKGEGDNAEKFAEEMTSCGLVEAVRSEQGNLRYEYFLPLRRDGSVLLMDSWQDQAALDAHHASPLMGKIAALREKYDLHMTVEKFVSAQSDDGDEKFVRK